MIKRILAIILVLIMVVSLSACNQTIKTKDGITTKFNKKTGVLTISGKGVAKGIYPQHEDDLEEYDDETVKKVIIEEGITYLKNCFNHLYSLEEIEFPKTLHTIEESFIEAASIKSITIPSTVKKIFNNSFNDTYALKNLKFDGEIELNMPQTFKRSGIEKLIIPDNSYLCEAFILCENLKEIIIGANVACHKECGGQGEPRWNFLPDLPKDADDRRVYVYEPLYSGSEFLSIDKNCGAPKGHLPILIPKGKSYEDYKDADMPINPDYYDPTEDELHDHEPIPLSERERNRCYKKLKSEK